MTRDPQLPASIAPVRLLTERDLSPGNLQWNRVRCVAAFWHAARKRAHGRNPHREDAEWD